MRSVAAVLLAIGSLGAPAHATPRPTWADWVGDYAAKLVWTGCTTPGARAASLAIDAVDGALGIELTPAGGGLRALSLVEDPLADRLTAQQGDVTLAIGRPRPALVELEIELTSGCRVRGTLVRTSTRVPACDQLVALARIEGRCTKLPAAALEDPRALARERWKPAQAERCAVRAAKVEQELVDAGCLPVADPADVTVGAECRQLASDAAKLKRCPTAPPEYAQIADRLSALARPAQNAASRSVADASCHRGHEMLVELAAYARCPL